MIISHINQVPSEVAKLFQLEEPPEILAPRYNVAPSQLVAVVGLKPGVSARGLKMMSWGFVPRWAKSPKDGPRPINARAETIRTSPPFRDSFKNRRCLIPADGYFEWKPADTGKVKQGYHIHPADGGLMAFAGIWDLWAEASLYSCAIVTVPANPRMREFHDRMPAIVMADDFDAWLAGTADEAIDLLQPAPEDYLAAVRVGPTVNKVKNDNPECIAPAA